MLLLLKLTNWNAVDACATEWSSKIRATHDAGETAASQAENYDASGSLDHVEICGQLVTLLFVWFERFDRKRVDQKESDDRQKNSNHDAAVRARCAIFEETEKCTEDDETDDREGSPAYSWDQTFINFNIPGLGNCCLSEGKLENECRQDGKYFFHFKL